MELKLIVKRLAHTKFRVLIFVVIIIQIVAAVFYHMNEEISIMARLSIIRGSGFTSDFESVHLFIFGYGHLFATLLLILILLFGYHYEIRQKALLQASVQKAELMALKAQIQPHFLFNTLNTIVYQIREAPEKASDTVRELADLYHYILQASNTDMNSLEQEIAFVKKYLDIEKSRFGERLVYDIDIPKNWLTRSVPTLILQPLVENAIKHGLADRLQTGFITITFEKNTTKEILVVEDNGIGIKEADLLTIDQIPGIGLKNVNERWTILTGNQLRIESTRHHGTRILLDW